MTAIEYLSQAYLLEQQIRSKQDQIDSLRSLASSMSYRSFDQEPVIRTKNVSAMEDTILKIIEATQELDAQIDALVDKKIEIARVIARISDTVQRLVLEKRHLSFLRWEEIAVDLHYSIKTVQRIHVRALEEVQRILDGEL